MYCIRYARAEHWCDVLLTHQATTMHAYAIVHLDNRELASARTDSLRLA